MQREAAREGAEVLVGGGNFVYRVVSNWARLPQGWSLGDVPAVAADRRDRIYVLNRGSHPLLVFDRDGNLLDAWGEGLFERAHGLHVAPDDTIFVTDDANHTVRKCTPDGKVLMLLGVPGTPSERMSGLPFHRCTHTASSPENDLYVADGYGNAKIHKFSPEGRLLASWGESGIDPGQFNIVHNICCDAQGWIYVADKENHRIQVFDRNGNYETQWNNFHRPHGLFAGSEPDALCYIAEGGPSQQVNMHHPNLGARVSIVTKQGKLVGRLGDGRMGPQPGRFIQPHGVTVDSRGDIYVGEVSFSAWPRTFPGTPVPAGLQALWKLVKV